VNHTEVAGDSFFCEVMWKEQWPGYFECCAVWTPHK